MFALHGSELRDVTHTIDTGSAKPVLTSPRRLPCFQQELEQEMTILVNTGCIEPSSSPYASALVLVRKTNGAPRVCMGRCKLEHSLRSESYTELIKGKAKALYLYHHIRMAKDFKIKTAFTWSQTLGTTVCHLV